MSSLRGTSFLGRDQKAEKVGGSRAAGPCLSVSLHAAPAAQPWGSGPSPPTQKCEEALSFISCTVAAKRDTEYATGHRREGRDLHLLFSVLLSLILSSRGPAPEKSLQVAQQKPQAFGTSGYVNVNGSHNTVHLSRGSS